jgi:TolB protein
MMQSLRLLLTAMLVLLTLQPGAQAFTWPKFNLRGLVDRVVPAPESPAKARAKRVHITEFTGATGGIAQKTLVDEITASREFTLTAGEADYIVSGSSVGGRVNGMVKNAAGKQLLERTYAAPGLDENLKAFTDDIIYAITGKPGLATSRLVFVSNRSGTKQIYICDSEGRDVQQVTRQAHGAVSPSLSPDGSLVAFTSYQSGFPVVFVLDLSAGWDRAVTDTPGSSFGAAFSPSGQRLAMVMSFLGNPEIFVTDLSTNTAGCISDTVGAPNSPSWHPDGKRILFSDDRGGGPRLYLCDVPVKGGPAAKLFRWRTGYSFCTDPEWSPDGRSVAFTALVGGQPAVIVKGFPNGSARQVQTGGAQHPSWSPNGRYLCYAQHGTLYVHDLNTNQRHAVLTGYGQISEPRWMR